VPRPFRQPRQHDYGLGPKSRKNESGLTQGPLSATSLGGPLSKSPEPLRGADALVCDRFSRGRPSRPAAEFRRAGILAGLGPLHPLPSAQPNAVSLRGGPGGPPPAEHAARLATPAPPWSAQSCVPRRQSCRWSASGLPPPLLWGTLYCGAGIPAGRSFIARCAPRSRATMSLCTSTPLTIQNPQKSSPSPSHPDVTRVKAASQPRIHSPLDDRPAVRK